ncbi:MAG: laccase domain-containing protein [Patescibacteria group bacterium]
MHASTDEGPILGLAHWGRDQLDRKFGKDAIDYLSGQGCDPRDIKIAIAPGIGPENYYIQEADMDRVIRNPREWGSNIEKRGNKFHLNLLGYLLEQLDEAGVNGKNIEAYGVDTYEAAERGEAFSYRYSVATGQPNRNGRMIIAAQLK